MPKISVVINTLNEENNLPRLLASVKNFADEIVVVDMHSRDNTQDIARQHGARVYEHEPMGYVEPARNYAVSKAVNEWVLLLDADEELSPSLADKLSRLAEENTADFWRIPRKNIMFGKWMKHSRWWPDHIHRFFKKDAVEWDQLIHGVPITHGKGGDLEAKSEWAIVHHHYDSIEQYIERMNRYTTIQADRLAAEEKFTWKKLISAPTGEFFSRYFYGEGYKDGLHGLAAASLQAVSELVVYLKLWQLDGFIKRRVNLDESIAQMRLVERDLHYWQADALVKSGGGMLARIKRKFKLP